MFAECCERATIVARRQPFANLALSHRSKDCSRPEDEVRPVIARSTCDEAIDLSRSHHGLLRFARNDGGKASDTRLNPAAHRARVVQEIPALFEQRAQGMPGARCAR